MFIILNNSIMPPLSLQYFTVGKVNFQSRSEYDNPFNACTGFVAHVWTFSISFNFLYNVNSKVN